MNAVNLARMLTCSAHLLQIERADAEREARKKEPHEGVQYVDFDGEKMCSCLSRTTFSNLRWLHDIVKAGVYNIF